MTDNDEFRKRIQPFFRKQNMTLIQTYLEGHMGRGWLDDLEMPRCAAIKVGDFGFIAGDSKSKAAGKMVLRLSQGFKGSWLLIIPENEAWGRIIKECYPNRNYEITRYTMEKCSEFPEEQLRDNINKLPEDYQLVPLNEELYEVCIKNKRMKDLCSQFDSARDYQRRGLGFCILHKGEVVCGASSYSIFNKGIEIEIDTEESHRRKGLATACASKLILECLKRDIYPSWDAANKNSVGLAEKLGYRMVNEYITYAINLEG